MVSDAQLCQTVIPGLVYTEIFLLSWVSIWSSPPRTTRRLMARQSGFTGPLNRYLGLQLISVSQTGKSNCQSVNLRIKRYGASFDMRDSVFLELWTSSLVCSKRIATESMSIFGGWRLVEETTGSGWSGRGLCTGRLRSYVDKQRKDSVTTLVKGDKVLIHHDYLCTPEQHGTSIVLSCPPGGLALLRWRKCWAREQWGLNLIPLFCWAHPVFNVAALKHFCKDQSFGRRTKHL